jgi:hypothetical protein
VLGGFELNDTAATVYAISWLIILFASERPKHTRAKSRIVGNQQVMIRVPVTSG